MHPRNRRHGSRDVDVSGAEITGSHVVRAYPSRELLADADDPASDRARRPPPGSGSPLPARRRRARPRPAPPGVSTSRSRLGTPAERRNNQAALRRRFPGDRVRLAPRHIPASRVAATRAIAERFPASEPGGAGRCGRSGERRRRRGRRPCVAAPGDRRGKSSGARLTIRRRLGNPSGSQTSWRLRAASHTRGDSGGAGAPFACGPDLLLSVITAFASRSRHRAVRRADGCIRRATTCAERSASRCGRLFR